MATTGDRDDRHERFWEMAEPLLASGRVVEGTMMGHQCLRSAVNDAFVATVERRTGRPVVKLPRDRVDALIADGTAAAFAPAGRVFGEWAAIVTDDDTVWRALLDESIDFVT